MELTDEMLMDIVYVQISNYRLKTMKSLCGNVKIPSVIARDAEIKPNHISTVLGELKEHGLVECINLEARKGRMYRLIEKGDFVVENLDKVNGISK